MADPNEPKEETNRVVIPPKPAPATPPDTVRIRLPARPLAARPMPPGPTASLARPSTAQSPLHPSTARLMPPDSAMLASEPTVQMKKTQAISPATENIPSTPLQIGRDPEQNFPDDSTKSDISKAFCWALLGISAVTLLIQIWTYFS